MSLSHATDLIQNVTPPRILTADWIAPMSAAYPIATRGLGVLLVGETIHAVGPLRELAAASPRVTIEDAGDAILLPGLVNAHVHLELSDATPGPAPTGSFGDWLLGVIRHTGKAGSQLPAQVRAAVEGGVRQCLRFGVTSVGDISRQTALTRAALQAGPLRVTSYGEIAALAKRRDLFDERLATAINREYAGNRLRIGLSPHAPYTVEPQHYTTSLAIAKSAGLPLATHLAESPDEATFLAEHRGPFRALWEALGAWDDHVPVFTGGPVRFANSLGLLNHPALLAHVNYCDDEEMNLLAGGRGQRGVLPAHAPIFRAPAAPFSRHAGPGD